LAEIKQFEFNERVATAFDDMISRSVPRYEEVTAATSKLAAKVCHSGGTVLDLGCSTGNALVAIANALPNVNLVGIDNSAPMLDRAGEKTVEFKDRVKLVLGDILESSFPESDLVILNYTLQFVPVSGRKVLLEKVRASLKPGGALILTEKLSHPGDRVDSILTDLYYDFKRENRYSELEISQKRDALENVLVPLSLEQNLTLLRETGFSEAELYLKWIKFGTFVALK
jgi:tRNA (cmo5U34)-methyltransferase